jgi:hypothetical protein
MISSGDRQAARCKRRLQSVTLLQQRAIRGLSGKKP